MPPLTPASMYWICCLRSSSEVHGARCTVQGARCKVHRRLEPREHPLRDLADQPRLRPRQMDVNGPAACGVQRVEVAERLRHLERAEGERLAGDWKIGGWI